MRVRLPPAALLFLLTVTSSDVVGVRGEADGVAVLLQRLEQGVRRGDPAAYAALLAESADRTRAAAFAAGELPSEITQAVVRERDRQPLGGTRPGKGFRLLVDVFEQSSDRGRIATWRLDVTRAGEPGADTEWLIADEERMTSVENLYKLSLDPRRQFAARDLRISTDDLELTLAEGSAFVSQIDQGITAMVLVGRGEMRFHPTPLIERGQVKIFGGSETLETRFDAVYLRMNPSDFSSIVATEQLVGTAVDPRELRRADDVFREEAPKSFGLELGDLTREAWWLVPAAGDLVAEIRTRRFDTLTYVRSSNEPEDINLFDRKRHRNIVLYATGRKLAEHGISYDEDSLADYDVIHYDIDVASTPGRQWIDARATLRLRVRASGINRITLRLAAPLVVQSIVSAEFGPLFGMRVKNQNSVIVNLPALLLRDTELTLTIAYAGRLEPQVPDRETLAQQSPGSPADILSPEPSFLYSSGTSWYPQPSASDYATATLRITVPAALACVASGDLAEGSPTPLPAKDSSESRKLYVFTATQPLRYLSFVVGRFVRADRRTISFPPSESASSDPREGVWYDSLDLAVEASPRHAASAHELGDRVADIARFYHSILDDVPYPSFTVAVVEHDLPGGHSPGYFATLNQPVPGSSYVWRNDPVYFTDYPDFFIAHELAHQWWGQAVGWRNYHEQWLSEGFSQYFAALYAQHERGDEMFAGVMRQMHKWAVSESDQGPIFLGYRLGHIRGESRVFRALVYDKGAAVLHMLRRLVGDEAFFRGLRRFYRASRFQKVGTDDFRRAMEAEAGRSLERFFDGWIYGSTLPRLTLSYRVDGAAVVLHAEQIGELFDVPLAVTLQYTDRKPTEVVIPVTERAVDVRVPLAGPLRRASISKNDGALVEIAKN